MLDMATTVAAEGKIEVKDRQGKPLLARLDRGHRGAARAPGRQTSTRAARLLPLGGDAETAGYKGYGLALAVDILSGILPGAGSSVEVLRSIPTQQKPVELRPLFRRHAHRLLPRPGRVPGRHGPDPARPSRRRPWRPGPNGSTSPVRRNLRWKRSGCESAFLCSRRWPRMLRKLAGESGVRVQPVSASRRVAYRRAGACRSEPPAVLTWRDRWVHVMARLGVRRGRPPRARPGCTAWAARTQGSPVFVTANYTLSFDALRSSLPGIDGYILVLDTQGINVWCAAGKGTFGTDELVRQHRGDRAEGRGEPPPPDPAAAGRARRGGPRGACAGPASAWSTGRCGPPTCRPT